jgi:hypothetical protein
MRPIEEDPGYQAMLAQHRGLAHRLVELDAELRESATRDLAANETIEDRLDEFARLRKIRDKAEDDRLLITQSIWNLKASWS